jgi:hypothetical protein
LFWFLFWQSAFAQIPRGVRDQRAVLCNHRQKKNKATEKEKKKTLEAPPEPGHQPRWLVTVSTITRWIVALPTGPHNGKKPEPLPLKVPSVNDGWRRHVFDTPGAEIFFPVKKKKKKNFGRLKFVRVIEKGTARLSSSGAAGTCTCGSCCCCCRADRRLSCLGLVAARPVAQVARRESRALE